MAANPAAIVPRPVLRSLDRDWAYARWERLPGDGTRHEVLDEVLYTTTSPSNFYQGIAAHLMKRVEFPPEDQGIAHAFYAPSGVLIPGAQPTQPHLLLVRRENAAIISDGRNRGMPELFAEILSASNPEPNMETKLGIDARAGVSEYLDRAPGHARPAPLPGAGLWERHLSPATGDRPGRPARLADATTHVRVRRPLRRCAGYYPLMIHP